MKRALVTVVSVSAVLALLGAGSAAGETPIEQAIKALSERLDAAPRDAGLLTDYGNLLTQVGRFDEALASYRSSLEVNPDSLITLYNLGLLEFELGHRRAAGRRFRRALKLDDGFARAHYGLGTVLAHRERHRRAVNHYARAFTLEPELLDPARNPELLFNRLATWASMQSYLKNPLQRGTRLYNDPQPIVGLLVRESELLEPAAVENPEPDEAPPEPAADESGN